MASSTSELQTRSDIVVILKKQQKRTRSPLGSGYLVDWLAKPQFPRTPEEGERVVRDS